MYKLRAALVCSPVLADERTALQQAGYHPYWSMQRIGRQRCRPQQDAVQATSVRCCDAVRNVRLGCSAHCSSLHHSCTHLVHVHTGGTYKEKEEREAFAQPAQIGLTNPYRLRIELWNDRVLEGPPLNRQPCAKCLGGKGDAWARTLYFCTPDCVAVSRLS